MQTGIDFFIINLAFMLTWLIMDNRVVNGELVKLWILFALTTLPELVHAYYTHNRRMLRAEKLMSRAFVTAISHILFFAAFCTFFAIPVISIGFFAALLGIEFALLGGSWLVELKLLKRWRRAGRNYKRVVIIGTNLAAEELAKRLNNDAGYGNRIIGYFDDECREGFKGNYCGPLSELIDFCRREKVDEIYYALSSHNLEAFNASIHAADECFCRFYYVPLMNPKIRHHFYMIALNNTIPAIGVHPSAMKNPLNRVFKRGFDIVFSSVALICSPIVFIPVAIAIKLDSPGPVFFKQKRTGYLGKDFYCYKFRTMKVNADADKVQATKDDDRKTKLGNFLRHSSIDELPQFWNVLRGDMSVVGPRPHMLAHTDTYRQLIDQYMVRHLVKPGITGWAQVNGSRGATDELWQMEERVEKDVWYIEHWSVFLDLKIIVKTITNAIHGEENAY